MILCLLIPKQKPFEWIHLCVLCAWRLCVGSSYPLSYCWGSLRHFQQPVSTLCCDLLSTNQCQHSMMYSVWMVSCVQECYRRDVCCHMELAALLYGVGNGCSAQGNTRENGVRLPEMKWTLNSFCAHTFLLYLVLLSLLSPSNLFPSPSSHHPSPLPTLPLHLSSSCQELVREMVACDIELFKKNPIAQAEIGQFNFAEIVLAAVTNTQAFPISHKYAVYLS